jgi:hypothetical protein
MRTVTRSLVSLCLGALAAAGLGACAHQGPKPFHKEELVEVTATVTAVDAGERMLSLRDEVGRLETVYVEPDVRNIEQIKVGDQVVVSYRAAVGAALTGADQSTNPIDSTVAEHRSLPGERPHGSVTASITATVQIDSVDTSFNTITFRRKDGLVRTVAISDPEAQKFIRGLKQGDLVVVTYEEALAVAVRPAG